MYIERPKEVAVDYLTESAKKWAQQFAYLIETRSYPTFSPAIEAVWIPGNCDSTVNARRIDAGHIIATNIAHAKKAKEENVACGVTHLTNWDMEYFSPIIFFNGTDVENEQLRRIQTETTWRIPPVKVVIADYFYSPADRKSKPQTHRNTHHQTISLFQQLTDQESPLWGKSEIAIVSSASHFVRIPFYLKYAEEMFEEKLRHTPTFHAYATCEGSAFGQSVQDELSKLTRYSRENHLATIPTSNIELA